MFLSELYGGIFVQRYDNEFNKLGLEHNGGNEGNFLYVNLGDQQLSHKLVQGLRGKKIYIRGGWPVPYATGVSISGAPKNIMENFFEEFSNVYHNILRQ